MLQKVAWKLGLSFLEFIIPNAGQISHSGTQIKDGFSKVLVTQSVLLLERGNWTIWIPLSIFSIHLIFIFSSILFLVYQHSLNFFHKMSFATTTNNPNNFLRFHYYYFHQLSCNRNLIPGVAQSQSIYYCRKNSGFVLSLLPCPLVPLPQVCKTWR